MKRTWLWPLWQAVVLSLAAGFTRRGEQRFVQWVTGLALNAAEYTVTLTAVALGRVEDWRKLETFAEHGSWNLPARPPGRHRRQGPAAAQPAVLRLRGVRWRRHQGPSVQRGVWSICTFREYIARCPNRAQTVRVHNWVDLGALLPDGERPALFLPVAARLYCRRCCSWSWRPSVLDVERLLRACAEELRQGLAQWLDHEGNPGE